MPKNSGESSILMVFVIIIFSIYTIVTIILKLIIDNINIIIALILSQLLIFIAYVAYSEIYFRSKRFKDIKDSIAKHTNDCNDLNHYIEKLKGSYVNIESYNYGTGSLIDNSVYNYKRREWIKIIQSKKIHHCSASICKNASSQPIKYLCKYFDIENNETSLSKFEKVLNDFISVEQGKGLVKRERIDFKWII